MRGKVSRLNNIFIMLYSHFFLLNFVSIFVAASASSTDGADGNEHSVSSQQETIEMLVSIGNFHYVISYCARICSKHICIGIDIKAARPRKLK